ncbi:MAG: hypothetical protein LBU76_11425 [Azoarcus sp.]|jgi:hypothetical protein|nr:hypothetical protein [Azoarcus sp.]
MRNFLQSQIKKFKNLPDDVRVYTIGLVLSLIVIFFPIVFGFKIDGLWSYFVLMVFAFGFLLRCFMVLSHKYFIDFWRKGIGKFLILGFHYFVFIIAQGFSTILVASSLGLPPQDFSIAVNLFAIYFYIPAWIISIEFLSLILLLIVGVLFAISIIANHFVIIFPILSRIIFFKKTLNSNAAFHFIGLVSVIWVLCTVFDYSMKAQKYLKPLVRLSVYAFDYQKVDVNFYPCIKQYENVRLHENGLISVAALKYEKWSWSCFIDNCVDIKIRSYEQCLKSESIRNNP